MKIHEQEHEEKKAFFNERAAYWDDTSRSNLDKVTIMLQLLNIKNGDKVLDVGTGTGVLLPLLAALTAESDITAIDIAENMIETAKQKTGCSEVTFVVGDALNYPFEPKSFDHIICYSVFPHFEDKPGTIRHLSSLLKPGGLLGILHSASRNRINNVHIHIDHDDIKGDNLPPAAMVMNRMVDCGLREEIRIDTPEMYMLSARKRWHS